MVLQRIVVVEVLPLKPFAGFPARHHGTVVGVSRHGVAIEGEAYHGLAPLGGMLVLRHQGAGTSQHVGLPAVLLGFCVAGKACRHLPRQLVVGLCRQQLPQQSALAPLGLVQEMGCQRHAQGPQRALPLVVHVLRAPVFLVGTGLQLVAPVGAQRVVQGPCGHTLQVVVADAVGQAGEVVLTIAPHEGGHHCQVGIGAHSVLVALPAVPCHEIAAGLSLLVLAGVLVDGFHVGHEAAEHRQTAALHLLLAKKIMADDAFRRAGRKLVVTGPSQGRQRK